MNERYCIESINQSINQLFYLQTHNLNKGDISRLQTNLKLAVLSDTKVTSFLSTDCELSTETCSKIVYSLGPLATARNLPNGGDTSRVAMSPIVSTACAYGSSPNGGDTARIVERSERKYARTRDEECDTE